MRHLGPVLAQNKQVFQSTHPLRGATLRMCAESSTTDFNPRTPCGVRPGRYAGICRDCIISIHAPLAGCDLSAHAVQSLEQISIHAPLAGCDSVAGRVMVGSGLFQSTHPLRGATSYPFYDDSKRTISIHAPLAGCDSFRCTPPQYIVGFQSTHPLRGATLRDSSRWMMATFQSTHPLRGATGRAADRAAGAWISIHAPLAGCDAGRICTCGVSAYFNPRTPCGVRPFWR